MPSYLKIKMFFYPKFKYLIFILCKIINFFYLSILEYIPTNNYSVGKYYGRFGNNLQQICNGIIFSQLYGKNFSTPKHPYLKTINFKKNNSRLRLVKKYRFFEYSDKNFINSDTPKKMNIPYSEALKKSHAIFSNIIFPKLTFYKDLDLSSDKLIIHIRSGDIFEKTKHYDQLQNPLAFYLKVIENFNEVVIVTEGSRNNPVIQELSSIKNINVTVQSGTIEEDFNILLNAKNLCLSGVGTFGIAAALLSPHLKNLYFSDIYLRTHLNPEMISTSIMKHKYVIPDYLVPGEWSNSERDRKLMLSSQLTVKKVN